MKKMKRLLCLTLALALCLSLGGCRQLDDMKSRHATWMDNGNILWNDNVYIPLYTTSTAGDYEYVEELNWEDSEVIHVTKPDVPVLLSERLGTNGYTGAGGMLLEVNSYVVTLHNAEEYEYVNTFYCRADMYNWALDALQNGYEIQEYGYYFYDYETGEETRGGLTNAQRQAIEDTLHNVTPMDSYRNEHYDYYDHSLTISAYSTAHLFSQAIGELFYNNGQYCIEQSAYDDDGNYSGKTYVIPKKYNALFDELFKTVGLDKNAATPSNQPTLGESV